MLERSPCSDPWSYNRAEQPGRATGRRNERNLVDLSQQSITGHEFDLNRRGYDPDAVDAHLREIAAAVTAREAEVADLRRTITELAAKVQDADESEEALRLTLKAAAHAKEELLAGARETAQTLEREASDRAQHVISEAEARAGAVAEQAEAKARAMTEGASARAREVARAALSESELLVVRIEQLRAQVEVAEDSLQALSADAGPRLEEARVALDQALESARASAENPELLAAAAVPQAPPHFSFEHMAPETAGVAVPSAGAETAEPEPNIDDAPEDVAAESVAADSDAAESDTAESDTAESDTEDDGPDVESGDAPHLVAAGGGPVETDEPDAEPDQQHAEPPYRQAESSSDISDKVDRLLEELREVT